MQDLCENNVQAIEYWSLRDKSGLLQSRARESHRVADLNSPCKIPLLILVLTFQNPMSELKHPPEKIY